MILFSRMKLIALTLIIIATASVAYLLAYLEWAHTASSGLARIHGLGRFLITAILLLLILVLVTKQKPIWALIAAAFLAASLFVDDLPLLAFGKAQLAMVLVALGQWAAFHVRSSSVTFNAILVSFFMIAGTLLDAAYFLAMLQHRNIVDIF